MAQDQHNQPDSEQATALSQPGSGAPERGAGESAGQEALTEYSGNTQQTAGFRQAEALARQASSEQGRLLKKRFVLEDIIGEGGMGRVYKARDLRKVEAEDRNPHVAVKVLGRGFREHPQAFVALQQEAVKSQKLAHPNIVTVHDFDRDGDTIYMTMELLKGDPLDALLRLQAPFAKEVALRYFNDMCAGLQYAHERGLIHSDLKPGNIFVTTAGVVKILDFGIARAATENALSHDYDAGSLGALTPAYATIEMINGDAPSARDDVYALACVLYLMLAGEHPYARKSAAEAKKTGMKPARPAALEPREWAALRAALSPEAAQRPASIAEFRTHFMPAARRSRVWLGALGAVLLVAAGSGAWVFQQQRAAEQANAQRLSEALRSANRCLLQQDFECAIEQALIAREFSAQSSEVDQLLAAAREGRERALAAQAVAAELARAAACLETADPACARVGIADARLAGATAAALLPIEQGLEALERDAAERLEAEQRARNAEQAALSALLRSGRQCLAAADLACARDSAAKVIERAPDNLEALALQQDAEQALAQQRFREQTVAAFLDEAGTCFERRDYSCSIAKAESALAIVAGHAPALAMIERAQQAQRAAKQSIRIQ